MSELVDTNTRLTGTNQRKNSTPQILTVVLLSLEGGEGGDVTSLFTFPLPSYCHLLRDRGLEGVYGGALYVGPGSDFAVISVSLLTYLVAFAGKRKCFRVTRSDNYHLREALVAAASEF